MMQVERVPRWRFGYAWLPYLRVGQAAHCVRLGPFRVYWLVKV